ncbi:MAG: isoleucine--tRNA ligase [Bacteroidales bacterium]|nr:MAG: isoleucine--tRNA ligase [Bacteroidales bacterium]
MASKFPEYKKFDLSEINKEVLKIWDKIDAFRKSLDIRKGRSTFVFYEGPPSANGIPGIHHVIARTIKDIFCRYKTMQGFLVERKAGWDTHGLPVELSVEQTLGITKEDIGTKISISEFNKACKKDVMKYTEVWEDFTNKMGYWINMDDPYITYDNRYIETLWYLLKKLYEKGLLYKGYSIQPYSPAAGTGLSTHELNQPGCYRDIKDTTVVAQFKIIRNEQSEFLFKNLDSDLFFLAWTTTPWTLLSNTALAVGKGLHYIKVRTFNHYTGKPVTVILAKDLLRKYFPEKDEGLKLEEYRKGYKNIPYRVQAEFLGTDLEGIRYEQLMPFIQPENGDAFRVLTGDFVTTEEGTGIVHIAPSFGADDFKVAQENGIGSLTLVDKQGKFVDGVGEFSGRYVKNQYDENLTEKDPTVDVDISVNLKLKNKAFKIEKYVHSYPHCWRTDKPVLYYPLDSWFIKSTAVKDRMMTLNNTINWKPPSTGIGRFGKWLENLVDWNLSRSRYWGTPLPIWITEDRDEQICIGSAKDLKDEIEKSIRAGFMTKNPMEDFKPGDYSLENYEKVDLHRPFVDTIILVSPSGKKMFREPDLIDGWFDSGAMPYAQVHYPFENKENFGKIFPADYIAEGVEQTRGWFFTLHAIAVMLFDSVAFKNIISNGLVLDKNGLKMSKRLGNAVDPFEIIETHGSDPLRWYMITNAQPWDNLKFDPSGIEEVKRKFFGTLFNTYSFFALYANVDGFRYEEDEIPLKDRPEIDRWIISLLNSLIKEVTESLDNYEPTKAGRAIQNFVIENLSNWYVRLNRKRYWGGDYTEDKIAAYQTLYTCLETVALLSAPIIPFYMDKLFCDLNSISGKHSVESIHLAEFPMYDPKYIDKDLEEKMKLAQKISSMVLGLRRKVNLKVRQPLNTISIPVTSYDEKEKLEAVKTIILPEVNVKKLKIITEEKESLIVKKIKPNFKLLGPRFGKDMKQVVQLIGQFTQKDINEIEHSGHHSVEIKGKKQEIKLSEVEIFTEDIPGWLVVNEGQLTVALDIKVTKELKEEGIAREMINRIQNLRKESGFDVTDKIYIRIQKHESITEAVENFAQYIGSQTLASDLKLVEKLDDKNSITINLDEGVETKIIIRKSLS